MEKAVIFGNKSTAVTAYYELTHHSPYEVVAFTVDRAYIDEDKLLGLPVIPFDEITEHFAPDQVGILMGVGYVKANQLRAERYRQAKEMGYQLISHVSPTAVTWPGMEMGDGCQIGPNSVIYPTVRLGNNVIVSGCCTIAHDTIIGDHCFLSDGVRIAGGATVEPYCFLAINATIRNQITIGRSCVIGAGAVVLRDTEEASVYVASPASRLRIPSDKLELWKRGGVSWFDPKGGRPPVSEAGGEEA